MTPAAALWLAAAAVEPTVYERAIEAAEPGVSAVDLDTPVYEAARLDLADLRVVDDLGAEVPFLLDRFVPGPRPEPWQPPLLNRSDEPGVSTRATLDLGLRAPKRGLELELSGDNFRRRVRVEASDDGESWRTLTDDAWVFSVPGPPPVRFETVRFPVNDQRHLRVTVFNGPDDPQRIRLRAARVLAPTEPVRREELLAVHTSRAEVAAERESQLVLELGARHRPFTGVVLEVADPRFFRRVRVEARREPLPRDDPREPMRWVPLGVGEIHRQAGGDGATPVSEGLRVDVDGRARVLRLRIENRDDPPLTITRAQVAVPVERVVFEAEPGRAYRLRYGDPERRAPEWDLRRSLPDPERWLEQAAEARLAEPRQVAAGEPAPLPWSERHPRLVLVVLIAVVAALGALTRQALLTERE